MATTREDMIRALTSEPSVYNKGWGWVRPTDEEAERLADSLIRAGVVVVSES